MESILSTIKKNLGIAEEYTAFDVDIITHINSAFSTLNQLGIGPLGGFSINDSTTVWTDAALGLADPLLSMVKTYIYLKVRLGFDPPSTSFVIDSINKQIEQLEWRMNVFREEVLHPLVTESEEG